MTWHLNDTYATQAGRVAAGTIGAGPPLVLAHGWPWSSFAWHRILPGLARHHTVYWYDMPGYGRSSMAPEQATSLDVQGAVFAEMLTLWGLERPRVLAHDFGGATSLRAHLLHGADYDHLMLMNVVAMRPWGSDFFTHVGRHIDAFLGLPPHIHEAVVYAYIRGALIHEIDAEDLRQLAAPWLSQDGRQSFYKQFAQADERFTADIEADFGQLRCPVTLLWGTEDPWIPLSRGLALKDRMSPRAFLELPGLGHLPQLEAPKVVLEALNLT
ncbi:MAG: alpha/beta hydrolase [Pseudomonadota bacterium]